MITILNQHITAFHYGIETKTVHIPIHHVTLNSGFAILIIDDWTDDTMVLTSAYVTWDGIQTGLNPTKFIIVCCQKQDEELQLLIFCAAVTSEKMINLCSTDVVYIDAVVKW